MIASIFRLEGDVKRATNPLILTVILNMILDPIVIYGLNLGIFGVGLATVIASFIGLLWMFYLIYIKKDTYFKFKFSNYKAKLEIYKEILVVSLRYGRNYIFYSCNNSELFNHYDFRG